MEPFMEPELDITSFQLQMMDISYKILWEHEQFYDKLLFQQLFMGCDKSSTCHNFQYCKILYLGMQNMFLGGLTVAVFGCMMYLLYKWVVHLGCDDFCNECGACTLLCNGHMNNNNDVRSDFESCSRRREVTRQESATNTLGKMKGRRDKVNRPDKDMYAADLFSVCRPNDCKNCFWQLLPSHEEQRLSHGLSGLSYRSMGKNTTTEMTLSPPYLLRKTRSTRRNPVGRLWIQANLVPKGGDPVGTDSFFMERSPSAQDVLPPHLRSTSNSPRASGSGMYSPVTPPPRYSMRNYWDEIEGQVRVRERDLLPVVIVG